MFQLPLTAHDVLTMSSDEDKIAAAEAELQECCTAISAELDKVHTHLLTYLTSDIPHGGV